MHLETGIRTYIYQLCANTNSPEDNGILCNEIIQCDDQLRMYKAFRWVGSRARVKMWYL